MILFVCYYKCFFSQNIFISFQGGVKCCWGWWTWCVLFSQFTTFIFIKTIYSIFHVAARVKKTTNVRRERKCFCNKVNMMSHEHLLLHNKLKFHNILQLLFRENGIMKMLALQWWYVNLSLTTWRCSKRQSEWNLCSSVSFHWNCHQSYILSHQKQFRLEKFVC